MVYLEILGYLLTGAAAAAVIKLIDNVVQWRLNRKAQKEDRAEAKKEKAAEKAEEKQELVCQANQLRIDELEDTVNAIATGQRFILLDRIRYLGLSYISKGEISFDERRLLHQMHGVYHHELKGNGDLDELMSEVDELPLKQ